MLLWRLSMQGLILGLALGAMSPAAVSAEEPGRALGEALRAQGRCSADFYSLSPDGRFMLELDSTDRGQELWLHDLHTQTVRNPDDSFANGFRWVGDHDVLYRELNETKPRVTYRLQDLVTGEDRSLQRNEALKERVLGNDSIGLSFGRRISFVLGSESPGVAPRLVTIDTESGSIVADHGEWPLGTQALHQNRDGVPIARRFTGPLDETGLARESIQAWQGDRWIDLLSFNSIRDGYRVFADLDLDPEADGAAIFMHTSSGRDRLELVRIELATGSVTTALRSEHGDLDWVFFTDDQSTPLFGISHDGLPVYYPLSETGRRLIELTAMAEPSYLRVMSATGPNGRATVRRTTMARGVEHLLVDLEEGTVEQLAACPFAGVTRSIAAGAIKFETKQGHQLRGVLVEPEGATGPLPLLIRPLHNTRSTDPFWVDAGFAAFFASRGYRVLTINYRGAWGSGSDFQVLGYRNLEGAYEDVHQAIEWSIAQGHATPDQIFLTGLDVAAQLSVAVLAKNKDLVAGAVVQNLRPDLSWLLKLERALAWPFEGFVRREGQTLAQSSPDPAAYVHAHSPSTLAAEIGGPLLLLHDTTLSMIPIAEIEALDKAIKRAGGRSEVFAFGASDKERFVQARAAFLLATLDFVERHLGRSSDEVPG